MYESILQEVAMSKIRNRTTEPLRRFVLGIVDDSLRAHYGENYSIRCLQGTFAIASTLNALGLNCTQVRGAVCVLEAKLNNCNPEYGWSGFWDQDKHAWAVTQFNEIVDLTISQLHLHPRSTRAELAVPAIWWNEPKKFPHSIIYLPVPQVVADLDSTEQASFDDFMALVTQKRDAAFSTPITQNFNGPILSSMPSLRSLRAEGNPWAEYTASVGFPKPHWIQNLINHLQALEPQRK